MASTTDERLQIRLGPAEKHLLKRAAAAEHQSVSTFVLHAAASRAEEILAERSVIGLSPLGAEALERALARPTQVNERLATALRRRRAFRWVD